MHSVYGKPMTEQAKSARKRQIVGPHYRGWGWPVCKGSVTEPTENLSRLVLIAVAKFREHFFGVGAVLFTLLQRPLAADGGVFFEGVIVSHGHGMYPSEFIQGGGGLSYVCTQSVKVVLAHGAGDSVQGVR